jgi:hypothetical protein
LASFKNRQASEEAFSPSESSSKFFVFSFLADFPDPVNTDPDPKQWRTLDELLSFSLSTIYSRKSAHNINRLPVPHFILRYAEDGTLSVYNNSHKL